MKEIFLSFSSLQLKNYVLSKKKIQKYTPNFHVRVWPLKLANTVIAINGTMKSFAKTSEKKVEHYRGMVFCCFISVARL